MKSAQTTSSWMRASWNAFAYRWLGRRTLDKSIQYIDSAPNSGWFQNLQTTLSAYLPSIILDILESASENLYFAIIAYAIGGIFLATNVLPTSAVTITLFLTWQAFAEFFLYLTLMDLLLKPLHALLTGLTIKQSDEQNPLLYALKFVISFLLLFALSLAFDHMRIAAKQFFTTNWLKTILVTLGQGIMKLIGIAPMRPLAPPAMQPCAADARSYDTQYNTVCTQLLFRGMTSSTSSTHAPQDTAAHSDSRCLMIPGTASDQANPTLENLVCAEDSSDTSRKLGPGYRLGNM